jgi:hypothetical protein
MIQREVTAVSVRVTVQSEHAIHIALANSGRDDDFAAGQREVFHIGWQRIVYAADGSVCACIGVFDDFVINVINVISVIAWAAGILVNGSHDFPFCW